MEKQNYPRWINREKIALFTYFIVFLLGSGFGASGVLLWYVPSYTITTITTIATLLGLLALFAILVFVRQKNT